jgi:hypothetical protein
MKLVIRQGTGSPGRLRAHRGLARFVEMIRLGTIGRYNSVVMSNVWQQGMILRNVNASRHDRLQIVRFGRAFHGAARPPGTESAFHVGLGAVLFVVLTGIALAGQGPPHVLVEENCRKATAILRGNIVSSSTEPGHFTVTDFRITLVYKGPFHKAERLSYRSFREQATYSDKYRKHPIVVFLIDKKDDRGNTEWGTASDLAEFPASKELERELRNIVRATPEKNP